MAHMSKIPYLLPRRAPPTLEEESFGDSSHQKNQCWLAFSNTFLKMSLVCIRIHTHCIYIYTYMVIYM